MNTNVKQQIAEWEMEGRNRVVSELENEFAVLNICDVSDWFKVTMGVDFIELGWEAECKHIQKFCENFQLYLYEVPGDRFYEWEGIEKAKSMGYKGVILSSLS
jgi:hypothetical protein